MLVHRAEQCHFLHPEGIEAGELFTTRPSCDTRHPVRCCLADATPSGLTVAWPADAQPKANEWLAIQGTMAAETRNGERIAVVVPTTIKTIPRPKRPLEP